MSTGRAIEYQSKIITFPAGTTPKKVNERLSIDRSSGTITGFAVRRLSPQNTDYLLLGLDVKNREVLTPLSDKLLENQFQIFLPLDFDPSSSEFVDIPVIIAETLGADIKIEVTIKKENH